MIARAHVRSGPARPVFRRRTRPGWRRWFPVIFALGLLAAAPALSHAQVGADSVALHWTAVGDDSLTGTATLYDVRMSTAPITEGNWSSATVVSGAPTPLESGNAQSLVVRGLTFGTTYYFGIKTVDDAGNWSGLSNVLRWDWIFDSAPPAAPVGLVSTREGRNVHLTWTAGAEPDLSGYTVYRATSAGGPFTSISGPLLGSPDYVDAATPNGAESVWYSVSASDVTGNESPHSSVIPVSLDSGPPSLAIQTPFPNPSRVSSTVRIPIVVPESGSTGARIEIVDSGNQRVRTIDLGTLAPGVQEIQWDGLNSAGRGVAPGAYRAWLIAGDLRQCTRLVRLP